MKNRWTEQGARKAIERWGSEHGEDFALRLYSARLIGADPHLVLHGGGNVSLEQPHHNVLGEKVEAVRVKATGGDLASVEPADMPALDLAYLRRLRSLRRLTDPEMVNEIRRHLFDASAPTPSIEALLHAFLPHRFVDHSHADAVLVLTNQPNGAELIREAVGPRVAVVEYVKPGFELAKAVADAYEATTDRGVRASRPQEKGTARSSRSQNDVDGIILLQHGLITFGDDARTSYDRHIAIVDACEQFIQKASKARTLTPSFKTDTNADDLAVSVGPLLRGLLAWPTSDEDHPFRRSVLEWRLSDDLLQFANSAEARTLVPTGPLTGDHLIRTKPWPMFVEDPDFSDDEALRRQLQDAVEAYRQAYRAYVASNGGSLDDLDPSPLAVVLPGIGLCCLGKTKRDACIAADITEHTLAAKTSAHCVGTYTALAPAHLYDMEFRVIQRRKLDGHDLPLAGQVVAISGGAGAIGAAIAEGCARAGAHVAIADLDETRTAEVVNRIESQRGPGSALGVTIDVTDEASVRSAYDQITRAFGGVDVVIPNAGIAHVSPIEDMSLDDFRRVMDINAIGYMLFMREGIRILKRQGLGGHIIISASKNVFGPGKDFGAYSASKAAGHQLGKVAAIELAPSGIRVNMINADAVFSHEQTPSGLWQTVGPGRAKSRGMKTEDLPEYYRQRNLLKARVYGHHVANAVLFFATNATPTTGATLPIDGGVIEAFPR